MNADPEVIAYQKALNEHFNAGLKEDGVWGDHTQNAYDSFVVGKAAPVPRQQAAAVKAAVKTVAKAKSKPAPPVEEEGMFAGVSASIGSLYDQATELAGEAGLIEHHGEDSMFTKVGKAFEGSPVEMAKQYARKKGWLDDSQKTGDLVVAKPTVQAPVKTTAPKRQLKNQPKVAVDPYQLVTARDTSVYPITQSPSNPANWIIDENNPDIKARYSYVGNRSERMAHGTQDVPEAKVVSDFLLDESFVSGYQHDHAKWFHEGLAKKPEQLVTMMLPDHQGTMTPVIKPYGEFTETERQVGKVKRLRTLTLSQMEADGTLQGDKIHLASSAFSKRGVIHPTFPVPGNQGTKDVTVNIDSQDALGSFAGSAVTLAYKGKDGNYKHERLNGSVAQIIRRAQQLRKESGGADVTMMLADVGSFSKKPFAGPDNILHKEQQDAVNSYNPDSFGGATEILRADHAKAYRYRNTQTGRDTTVVTSNPNNSFVKEHQKKEFGGDVLEQFTNGGTAGSTASRPRMKLPTMPGGPKPPVLKPIGANAPFAQQGVQKPSVPMVGAQLPAQPTMDLSAANPPMAPDAWGNVPDAAELRTPEQQAAWQKQESESTQRVVGDVTNTSAGASAEEKKNPFAMGSGGGGSDPNSPAYGSLIASGISAFLGKRDEKAQGERMRLLGNTDSMEPAEVLNPFGNYTPNAGIGNNFQPTQHTATQRYAYEEGGQTHHAMPNAEGYSWLTDFLTGSAQPYPAAQAAKQFAAGGEYQLSDMEIADLRAQGYDVQEV